ncbi:MAG: insulinase family protein [Acidobacteria bacterium]|nr:insulinase family protein [Acidobacteriota bacterium]
MKTSRIHALIVVCALAFATAGTLLSVPPPATGKDRYVEKLVFPPLNKVASPAVERYTLPNGLKVYLCEDHEFPKVQFSVQVRGGEIGSPDRAGLVELFGEVLRSGGTQSMNGDKVDEYLEGIGASISSGADTDSVNLYGSTLTENLEAVLTLFAEFVTRPGLTDDKLDLARIQARSAISRRNDEVMALVQREFAKLIYGANSPYARQMEYDDVNAVTREDLVRYHGRFFRPDFTALAVWGDFDAARMKALLEKLFGGWKNDTPAPAVTLPAIPERKASVNYIEKKDVKQTFILFGLPGIRYDDPDYPAVRLMTDILGGGFSSRLFKSVRTEKGLAYSAGGTMMAAFDHPGAFFFFTSTKPASTGEAIDTTFSELRRITQAPVTEAEMALARNSYLNAYAFEYDDTGEVVRRLMIYDFYGYPADFNEKLRAAVEKVTRDDILRVAQKYLVMDRLTLLAAGKGEDFDKPLSTYGAVNTIDVTIPMPKSTEVIPEATPETLAKGTDLLRKAGVFLGEKALRSLRNLASSGKATRSVGGSPFKMDLRTHFVLPDRLRQEVRTPMGNIVIAIKGETGWMSMGPQTMPLPGSQAEALRLSFYTGYGCVLLLKEALEGKIQGQALGEKDFAGKKAQAVRVMIGKQELFVYLDPASSELVGIRHLSPTEKGPAMVEESFSGWKDFGGLKLPTAMKQVAGEEELSSMSIDEATLDGDVDPTVFEPPADTKDGEAGGGK